MYCNWSCLWVCNGRAVSEPYYSQRARAQCLRLSERFFHSVLCLSFSVLFICIYSLWWRLIVFIAELVTGCEWSATNWCKSSVTSRCRSVSAGGRRCRSVHLRHYSRHWTRLHAQVCSLTLTLYQKWEWRRPVWHTFLSPAYGNGVTWVVYVAVQNNYLYVCCTC